MGFHCFGFLCVKGVDKWSADCIIDEWVDCAKTFGVPFDVGLLFPRLKGMVRLILIKGGRQRTFWILWKGT